MGEARYRSLLVARNAAVVEFHDFRNLRVDWVKRAIMDGLAELRGRFEVWLSPGLRPGSMEIRISQGKLQLYTGCIEDTDRAQDILRCAIAALQSAARPVC